MSLCRPPAINSCHWRQPPHHWSFCTPSTGQKRNFQPLSEWVLNRRGRTIYFGYCIRVTPVSLISHFPIHISIRISLGIGQKSYLTWHLSCFANLQFVEYELFDGFVISLASLFFRLSPFTRTRTHVHRRRRASSHRTWNKNPVPYLNTCSPAWMLTAHTSRTSIWTLKVISITCFRRFCFSSAKNAFMWSLEDCECEIRKDLFPVSRMSDTHTR